MSPHRVVRSVLSRLASPGPLLAIGLGTTTVAGSLWIATANRSLDSGSVKALLSFYFLLGTIGTGVLAGLEQEMTRTVARAHAAGRAVGLAVRGQVRQALGLAAATVIILLAASPLLLSHWLRHSRPMELALLAGLVATWASFLVRGVLAGCQDFRYYSLTLVVQGVATVVPSLILVLAGHGFLLGYAFIFALAPLVAAASGLASPALRRSWRATGVAGALGSTTGAADSPEAATSPEAAEEPGGSLREKLILLTLATLVSQLLINAVPLIVTPWLSGPVAKSLGSSMGMSRLALLCLFPLQAPLLPLLAAAATRHDFREVRRKTGFLVAACLGAGVLGVAAVAAAGPWLLKAYFATDALSRPFLAALALSTAFLMTAFVLQSAQVALNRHRVVLVSWLAGLAAMAVVFVLPLSPLGVAAWAGVLGPLVVTVIAAADVMFVTRSPQAADTAAAGDAEGAPAPVAAAPAGDARGPGQASPVAEGVR